MKSHPKEEVSIRITSGTTGPQQYLQTTNTKDGRRKTAHYFQPF
jgi:phenylacetate-coenzyme A ligase PaaK-like adenylate-forming protein